MFKIIGAVMVISGAFAVGAGGMLHMKKRVNNLKVIISALELMKAEISERLTPLPQVIEMLENESEQPIKNLFTNCKGKIRFLGKYSFSTIWKESVDETSDMDLKSPELEVIKELGTVLGRYDAQQQREMLEHIIKRLEIIQSKAEHEQTVQGKTRTAMGIALAVITVIMLV